MNARTVQIDFDEAPAGAPVTLRFTPSPGVRSADIKEFTVGPKLVYALAGSIRPEAARPDLFVAGEKPFSRHPHPIQWGINE